MALLLLGGASHGGAIVHAGRPRFWHDRGIAELTRPNPP
jgi:hypothetical protein